ncbi:LAGLIDADG family homing endonuclease [Burkholderia multivorans]|uniref:LAGLIDADG family homing endonuclease n=1 Tax=Burkholderia multivorans TaxID=87883 RepID=UPI001B935841|nr:LAGLIDADG family homing endonuclease [Burkholderia multivorans]MBR8124761.1 LAGLIDADG family homing endonuclease [Burkholderia multivorans]
MKEQKQLTDDQAAAYIAAFIDGEGHIGCHITGRGRPTKTIEFVNTDQQLFDRVISLANQIGLRFRVYFKKSQKEGWSDVWVAYLADGKEAFERFEALVPLQCERKIAALRELIQSYKGPEELEKIYASRRTSIEVACKKCSKPFFAFPSDIKRGHGIYCSAKCQREARTKKIKKTCATCGTAFFVFPARDKTAKFCSQSCFGKSQSERLAKQSSAAAAKRWGTTKSV